MVYKPYMCIYIYMGVSENVVYPNVPNGFADHYPYENGLVHAKSDQWMMKWGTPVT